MVSDGTEFAVGEILRNCLRKLDETQTLSMKNGRNIIVDAGVMCKLRKCDEMEIRTGSSDSNSSRHKSSSFDRVQRRTSELQNDRKKGLDVKRELEEKGLSFKNDQETPNTQDKVAASENRYNLRPRGGREVESRTAMEMKSQQGGPIQSRKSRGRNDNPYIEERTRSVNRNARRRGDQQREEKERKGASTRRSLSLKVLLGSDNYKS
ncbi:uncharacterized protein TNCV_3638621 [Trichonephila clavipes]|nr:uncharacterized protein TNCV_3638621 [Trichonephila clavipes]